MAYRIVFMGSPEFAVPSLDVLCEVDATILIVTQPDRKKGRGQKTSASPVKQAALQRDLEVADGPEHLPQPIIPAEMAGGTIPPLW